MEKYFSKLLLALFLTVTFFSCKKAIETDNSNDNSNGTGYIYNAYSNLPIFQIPLGGGSGSIPPSYDLTPFMPPIRNQNPQNSCVGFCLATLKSFHERLEYGYTYSGNDKIMSPAFIYNQKKSGANCKAGTDPVVALDFLKTDGISTEAEFPFDENDCSSIPSNLIKVSALKNKIRAWEAFNFQNNPNVLSEIKYAISQMQPVIAGIKIDNEFKSRDLFSWGTNIWKQNNSTTPVENGHCVLLVGYDDAKNAFKLLNSWGTWWKNDGYCWVDYSWFLQRKLNAFMTYDEFHTTSTGNLEIIGALDYGNVTINTTSTKTIQLKNNGTTNINISNVSITSPYSTNWSSGVITPNSTQNVTISFNPIAVGSVSRTLTVNSNASNNVATIQATGNGVQQVNQTRIISLSGNLAYGNVTVGQTSSRILTISNTGNSALTISSISLPQGFSANYSGTIQSGNSVNVSIIFSPSIVQTYNGNIIVNSDATSGINSISSSGTGTSSGGGIPVAIPTVGTYGNCSPVGTNPNCSTFSDGTINARIVSINTTSKQITFEIKKCNGTAFNAGGTFYVSSGLCTGVNYGAGSFNSGGIAVQMTVIDNNMTGTKVYYPYIIQGTQSNIYYDAPYIVVTY